ncbi:PREDICTED: microsomal glutathione S-transferase 1 [Thamnophis sirtalis]|uniref:Microsomal glutathione S-transferase 1 n=1 Tax=Thamnophis sirtalis TaxID=35019 RepID=A0A6I9YIR7_9SAUR|nr:PREDICTED: microsomal glutathione S-transferase 1 [Thamnophis sirtalis]
MGNFHELLDHEVTLAFMRYGTIVVLKMMLMSTITAFFRMKKKVRDESWSYEKKQCVDSFPRIHLNDLENIIPFLFAGFFYSFSGVSLSTALLHYRIFLGSRIFHTIAYLVPLPQPSRGLAWMAGYLVTFSMMYKVIMIAFTVS